MSGRGGIYEKAFPGGKLFADLRLIFRGGACYTENTVKEDAVRCCPTEFPPQNLPFPHKCTANVVYLCGFFRFRRK
jgi:hypothetical protein